MMWWRKAQEDETFFLSEDLMSMHGVLYKKGRNLVKKYKKRWFVLPENSFNLNYYSAPHGKLLGQIDINNILDVQPLASNKKLYGMYLKTTSSKVYALYARTLEERDGWCCGLTNRLRDIATTKLSIREVVVPVCFNVFYSKIFLVVHIFTTINHADITPYLPSSISKNIDFHDAIYP
jgi:hypothetical protein